MNFITNTQKIIEATKLIDVVYDFHLTGGNLHIQIDDENVDDIFFEKYDCYIEDTPDEQKEAEIKCFNALKKLTVKERAMAIALQNEMESCK